LFSYSHPYGEALLEPFVLLFTPLGRRNIRTLSSLIHTLMVKQCWNPLFSYSQPYGETLLEPFVLLFTPLG